VHHPTSVFHSLLKHIPWDRFADLVKGYKADRGVRRLTTKSQLVALLYAQLGGASSLRDLEAGLRSHRVRLYHVGATAPARSTLADANAKRPAGVFTELFALMAGRANRALRRGLPESTYLIDSTGLRLNTLSAEWAHYRTKVNGAKLHVIYDADGERPIYHAVTPARINDISKAQRMPVEVGATYVFDLGYYDFDWWAKLDQAGCRIVTRLKKNTPLATLEDRELSEGSAILLDRIGTLPRRQAMNRRNPFQNPVREIKVQTDTGKVLRILSNDLDAPAEEIAALYKRRWAIELFFRWIKQTLKITRFLGTSENALRIEIAVALIAFLLLRLAQATQDAVPSPLTFARLIRTNLMHRRQLKALLYPEPGPAADRNQLALQWAAA